MRKYVSAGVAICLTAILGYMMGGITGIVGALMGIALPTCFAWMLTEWID